MLQPARHDDEGTRHCSTLVNGLSSHAPSRFRIEITISNNRQQRGSHGSAENCNHHQQHAADPFRREAGTVDYDVASQRSDMEIELIDLRDYPMPFFDEVASNAWAPTQNEVGQRWQKKIAEFDGYISSRRNITAASQAS
jgi:hypothetical protein